MRARSTPVRAAGIAFGVVVGAGLLAVLDGAPGGPREWLAYAVLLGVGAGAVSALGRLIEAPAHARRPAWTALLVRLVIGVALMLLLPVYGYEDSVVTRAGYYFFDAFHRDREAWELARLNRPVWDAFGGTFSSDQYGGMLALSAAVYRYFSPGDHHPFLILILTASAGGIGTLFLWKAVQAWFAEPAATAAAWIFALYPEAVILGGSHMREAFLIPGVALAFFALTRLESPEASGWRWLLLAAAVLLPLSPPVALATFAVLLGAWLLGPGQRASWRQAALLLGVLVVGLVIVVSFLAQYPSLEQAGPARILIEWLQYNFGFQSHLLERASGWVQKLVREAGQQWQTVIVVVYGLARPVLPAAIIEPAPWIWQVTGTLRAAGWYALAPLLFYGAGRAVLSDRTEQRARLVWLSVSIWAWVVLSAFVAGGDLFDNPRYRTTFLAWEAALAAWAWAWARAHRDAWLTRWLLVEGVFLVFFTEWYFSRYTRLIDRPPFWIMVALILAASAAILGGGWWLDRRRSET